MEKADKRLSREGYKEAKDAYERCMMVLNKYLVKKKELRTGLMNFYPNSWMKKNMVAVTSKNFKLTNLKQFLCYEVLKLSDRCDATIAEYDRYFDLKCQKQRVRVDLDTIVSYANHPELFMKRLRELTYEKYLLYLDAKDETEDEGAEKNIRVNAKKKAYLEFAKALLLYDIFVKEGMLWIVLGMEKTTEIMDELDEQGDWGIIHEALGTIPEGAVHLVDNLWEWCKVENRHVISLYAFRTMVQLGEYLSSFGRCLGSPSLEKMAIPEEVSDSFQLTKYIRQNSLAEKLMIHTIDSFGDKLRLEYAEFFSYYKSTLSAGFMFTSKEDRLEFEKAAEAYLRWIRAGEWEKEEDAIIRDVDHPELVIASVSFTDKNIDLLPPGESVWSIFIANMKREE